MMFMARSAYEIELGILEKLMKYSKRVPMNLVTSGSNYVSYVKALEENGKISITEVGRRKEIKITTKGINVVKEHYSPKPSYPVYPSLQ